VLGGAGNGLRECVCCVCGSACECVCVSRRGEASVTLRTPSFPFRTLAVTMCCGSVGFVGGECCIVGCGEWYCGECFIWDWCVWCKWCMGDCRSCFIGDWCSYWCSSPSLACPEVCGVLGLDTPTGAVSFDGTISSARVEAACSCDTQLARSLGVGTYILSRVSCMSSIRRLCISSIRRLGDREVAW